MALAALAAGAASPHAQATQWSIEPQLALLLDYNSNLLLQPTNPQGSEGTTLSVDANMKRVTDTTEMDLHPHLDVQRYASEPAFDSNNGSLQASASAHSERSSIAVTGGYAHASTLITEPSDTGVIDASTWQETASAGLSLGHDLTERQHLDLEGTYTDVVYPGGEHLGLVGYRYPAASLTDKMSMSLRTTLSASVFVSDLHAPLTGYDSRAAGGNLSMAYTFSAHWAMSAQAGVSETDVNGYRQHGYLWDLHVTRNAELGQLDFDASQTLQPSGRGYLMRRDAATVTLSENIAPQLFATVNAQDIHNSNLASSLFLDVPRYLSGNAGLEWHASPHIVLSLTAGVTQIEEPVTRQLVHGWQTAFTTRWSPSPWATSR